MWHPQSNRNAELLRFSWFGSKVFHGTPNSVARIPDWIPQVPFVKDLCRRRVQDLLDRFFLDAAVQDPFVQGLYETKQRSTMFKHVLEKLR